MEQIAEAADVFAEHLLPGIFTNKEALLIPATSWMDPIIETFINARRPRARFRSGPTRLAAGQIVHRHQQHGVEPERARW